MNANTEDTNLEQIEYLLYQSTQGIHFMFDNPSIARVLSQPTDDQDFFTFDNMNKVQGILTKFIEQPSMQEKQAYLDRLSPEDYDLLIRAYFHLVENTILANTSIRH